MRKQGDGCGKISDRDSEHEKQGERKAVCPLISHMESVQKHMGGNVLKSLEENLKQSKDCFTRIKTVAWGILLGLK